MPFAACSASARTVNDKPSPRPSLAEADLRYFFASGSEIGIVVMGAAHHFNCRVDELLRHSRSRKATRRPPKASRYRAAHRIGLIDSAEAADLRAVCRLGERSFEKSGALDLENPTVTAIVNRLRAWRPAAGDIHRDTEARLRISLVMLSAMLEARTSASRWASLDREQGTPWRSKCL